uniref:C2 domain-containing protein n=1 Tax=Esox lucius TaxID=8010 RepID=A0A3P8XHE3_ESOLU
MERTGEKDNEASSSHQNTMWKQFQAKAKPILSPKLSRNTDEKRERGSMWMFRKKKKHHVLDRVISSSQPDLFSAPVCLDSQESPHCGKADPSSVTSHSSRPLCYRQTTEETVQPDTQKVASGTGSPKHTMVQLMQSHHKSSSLGSACLEKLVSDTAAITSDSGVGETPPKLDKTDPQDVGPSGPSGVNTERALPNSGMYQLDITLNRGHNLAVRDRGGTSDPYVKFKLGGKEVFRSKTIYKNLNPVWDEGTNLLVDSLQEPLYVKVFDYDFGLQDDFMGSAYLYLESLEQHRYGTVGLCHLYDTFRTPSCLMCITCMFVILITKLGNLSLRLSELHRKAQLWRGIVSISLIEGRNLCPMDPNGLSDPYAKFRLGNQKYKSKVPLKDTCTHWREQFDLHLYEETGGILDISVWDKDTGRRDDFIGGCTLDLSTLAKEHTHRLELPLQESRGSVVLLVTLTATSHVSIAELSLTPLDNPQERKEIMRRYGMLHSLSNMKDVGIVQVKVLRAEGLMAADVTGKSDPFCVLELNNDRLRTHTVYKNLNPEWNKVFTFNVKDIHLVLEVTVFDEDRDRSADFLGKVAIPLLNVSVCVLLCVDFKSPYGIREPGDMQDSERKGFIEKLHALQDVCVSVQSSLDHVASFGERIKNTFNWTVPFLSWLAICALCVATVLLYLIPLRYLIIAWGVNKFTKKLRNPYMIDSNEVLDFLSRVPSDVQVTQYRELKINPGQSPIKRKKINPS